MNRKNFYVQLHIHSSESSRCGVDGAEKMVEQCKRLGYDMIVMTDHFLNANTTAPMYARWEEKVKWQTLGYKLAKAEGDRIGVRVLLGWEAFTGGPEYLTYGLDEEFLLDNPGMVDMREDEYLKFVRSAGAFVTHAHPYRQAYYISPFKPDASKVDAIEVYNGVNREPSWNAKAYRLAQDSGKIMLAGSDAHRVEHANRGAVCLPEPVGDMGELIAALRSGQARVVEDICKERLGSTCC